MRQHYLPTAKPVKTTGAQRPRVHGAPTLSLSRVLRGYRRRPAPGSRDHSRILTTISWIERSMRSPPLARPNSSIRSPRTVCLPAITVRTVSTSTPRPLVLPATTTPGSMIGHDRHLRPFQGRPVGSQAVRPRNGNRSARHPALSADFLRKRIQ